MGRFWPDNRESFSTVASSLVNKLTNLKFFKMKLECWVCVEEISGLKQSEHMQACSRQHKTFCYNLFALWSEPKFYCSFYSCFVLCVSTFLPPPPPVTPPPPTRSLTELHWNFSTLENGWKCTLNFYCLVLLSQHVRQLYVQA